MIELNNLSKEFQDIYILEDINWQFKSGAISVIVGPSGSGKTTLIRMMGLLEEPSRGSIYFNGVETGLSDSENLKSRRRMSLVSQRPVLFNDTVYNNVAYPLKVRGEPYSTVSHKSLSVLELVGLKDYKLRRAVTLSGGEIQRVAIARALITEPDVLLLDEPTTNLDINAKVKIEDLIRDIPRSMGSTVIMATHDIAQCQKLADEIIAITSNTLVSVDTPDQILSIFGLER